MTITEPDEQGLARAVELLRAGELVALPTETVYGLGADARNPAALRKIFAAKGRPADHPLIVHLASAEQLSQWAATLPDEAWQLAQAFWPGPLTLILPRAAGVPDEVTGGQPTVGLRVPGHPVALALLARFGGGIAAPSANRFGRISPTTARHVADELGERVPLILDGGPCTVGIESTIVDLSQLDSVGLRILRPGGISAAQIADCLARPVAPTRSASPQSGEIAPPRVSGSLAAHYAPGKPLSLLEPAALWPAVRQAQAAGERLGLLVCHPLPSEFALRADLIVQPMPNSPHDYARQLYASLRQLDAAAIDRILVEIPGHGSDWAAIADRLGRAAAGSGQDDDET